MNEACVWFSFFACVVIVDTSQHGSNVMSVWALQHVPECAIDHAFVTTISSLHSVVVELDFNIGLAGCVS